VIPPGAEIGFDPETDAKHFTIVDGIVVIPKDARIPEKTRSFVPGEVEPEPQRGIELPGHDSA
jgi:hypothetical protein